MVDESFAKSFFSQAWYRREYLAADCEAGSEFDQFMQNGTSLYYDPHPYFASQWYIETYRLPLHDSWSAFLHFIESGVVARLSPHPLIDLKYFEQHCDDHRYVDFSDAVFALFRGGLVSFLNTHPYFDSKWYLKQYPDVAAAGVAPLWHYITDGAREGRKAHPLFASDWYRETYGGDLDPRLTPLGDYAAYKATKGRRPNAFFDDAWYLSTYADVAANGLDPFLHYAADGAREGRRPGPNFDPRFYLNAYKDVSLSGVDALVHFLEMGQIEGRHSRDPYEDWLARNGNLTEGEALQLRQDAAGWVNPPLISIVIPVYKTPLLLLQATIESIENQTYGSWQLCISDDASDQLDLEIFLKTLQRRGPRYKVCLRLTNGHISENTNTALAMATGEYVAFLDADDVLSPDALHRMAAEIVADRAVDLVYSDEDKLESDGRRHSPHFKPDWDPILLLAQNYISHLTVMRRTLLEEIGGLRKGFEGAQDHELLLRAMTARPDLRVKHVPRVLYHWRVLPGSTAMALGEKSYAHDAGLRAVQLHGESYYGPGTQVQDNGIYYRCTPPRLSRPISVSVIVATTFKHAITRELLQILLDGTVAGSVEIVLAISRRHMAEHEAELMAFRGHNAFKIYMHDCTPFSFSRVNNEAASVATGEFLIFLNDDIELLAPGGAWIEALVSRFGRPEVGIVGALLLYPTGLIQHAGLVIGAGGVADHAFRFRGIDEESYFGRAKIEHETGGVTGACLCIRREVFFALGAFEEALAIAFQDVDLCLKVRESGLKVVYTPSVAMVHHESISLGKHDADARREAFDREVATFKARWGARLERDERYNPNLSLKSGGMYIVGH